MFESIESNNPSIVYVMLWYIEMLVVFRLCFDDRFEFQTIGGLYRFSILYTLGRQACTFFALRLDSRIRVQFIRVIRDCLSIDSVVSN